jgi:hypothetical protein
MLRFTSTCTATKRDSKDIRTGNLIPNLQDLDTEDIIWCSCMEYPNYLPATTEAYDNFINGEINNYVFLLLGGIVKLITFRCRITSRVTSFH